MSHSQTASELPDDVDMRVIRVLEYVGPAREMYEHLTSRVSSSWDEFGNIKVRELAIHREFTYNPTEESK